MMSHRGLTHLEQHFFFSNRLVQFFLGLHPYQNSYNRMFVFYMVMVHALPLIVHQFYQVYTLDMKLKSALKVLESMIPAILFLYIYAMVYFSVTKMKLLFAHIKLDYELVMNDEELNIMESYTNKSKLYVNLLAVFFYLYFISIASPSIFNVFLYIFGTWDGINLILPFPIHNVLQAGLLYYSLLIYQIIAAFISITIGIVCYSLYWTHMFHAFGQFNIIIKKVRQPFRHNQRHTQKSWLIRTPQEEWDWMIDIIKCYIRVTEFLNLMNNFSRIIYLIALFVSLILVFFHFLYMFELFNEMLNTRESIEGFVYTIVFLSTLYINFYMGQLLINNSNAAFTELCNIPFYILSIKTQKLLLFLLKRSIKPSVISIGGILVASHEVFAAVRKSAFPNSFRIFFMLTTNMLFQIIRKAFSIATVYYSLSYT